MTPEQVFDTGRLAISTLLWMSTPIMAVALGVGLVVALFQALTSIQEITLTFVPKILAVFMALIFFLPFMASQLFTFSRELFSRMVQAGL